MHAEPYGGNANRGAQDLPKEIGETFWVFKDMIKEPNRNSHKKESEPK